MLADGKGELGSNRFASSMTSGEQIHRVPIPVSVEPATKEKIVPPKHMQTVTREGEAGCELVEGSFVCLMYQCKGDMHAEKRKEKKGAPALQDLQHITSN